jgi:hypothetical protein
MSEFSDSYHLRAGEQQAGVDLLHAAGLGGYVFPPQNGWVTVVAEGEPLEPNQRLIRASTGVLLYYMHAEDHGWMFELYRDGRRVARYEAEWDNDIRVEVDELDRQVLENVLGDGIRALDEAAYHGIFMPDFGEFMEQQLDDAGPPPERFAETAGLPNVSWVSWSYVDYDYNDDPDLAAQGVVRVDAA